MAISQSRLKSILISENLSNSTTLELETLSFEKGKLKIEILTFIEKDSCDLRDNVYLVSTLKEINGKSVKKTDEGYKKSYIAPIPNYIDKKLIKTPIPTFDNICLIANQFLFSEDSPRFIQSIPRVTKEILIKKEQKYLSKQETDIEL